MSVLAEAGKEGSEEIESKRLSALCSFVYPTCVPGWLHARTHAHTHALTHPGATLYPWMTYAHTLAYFYCVF